MPIIIQRKIFGESGTEQQQALQQEATPSRKSWRIKETTTLMQQGHDLMFLSPKFCKREGGYCHKSYRCIVWLMVLRICHYGIERTEWCQHSHVLRPGQLNLGDTQRIYRLAGLMSRCYHVPIRFVGFFLYVVSRPRGPLQMYVMFSCINCYYVTVLYMYWLTSRL